MGDTERGHLGHGRQLATLPADGDGAGDPNVATGAGPEVEDLADHGGVVYRRVGVGHRHDRRIAAQGGGSGPGFDRLGLLPARLAQVGVEIDQSRSHEAAAGVEDHRAGRNGADLGPDSGDHSVLDQYVGQARSGRVDDGAAA